MKIEQFYTKCLAQGTYYIESRGEVAIIDPLREVEDYLSMIESNGHKLKYVFETHFHADFVSGHVTLANKTGAPIIYGPNANPDFEAYIAHDSEQFSLGDVAITVLHTPGHTLESTTYLLNDTEGEPYAIFSGDTLFLGDVGRPDLAQKGASLTQKDLAGMLFDSLRNKIMTLPDNVLVYPAHGAGSACGKNMSSDTVDTLGNQKINNYALRADMTKEEFIVEVTDGLTAPPSYFPLNVMLNKKGYADIDVVLDRGMVALDAESFDSVKDNTGAIVLDVRSKEAFAKGHIPRALFIGIDGGFAPWVGSLLGDIHTPILIVSEVERIKEVITRLARVGFDNVLGYLEGGFETWREANFDITNVNQIDANQVAERIELKQSIVVDVRKPSEYDAVHVAVGKNIPLSVIENRLGDFPIDRPFLIHCQSGYRSMIASSVLKHHGINNFEEIRGGFVALKKTDLLFAQA